MAKITRGYTFSDGEQLTPSKLNDLVEQATISNITASDLGASFITYTWGSTDPGVSPGNVWWDTGADPGLKFPFVTPSNASIADWLYATPRREAFYWTESAVSLGAPLFLYRRGFEEEGTGFKIYDGVMLPKVWQQAGSSSASGLSPYLVIAMESVTGAGPIKCAWAGLVPAWTHQSLVSQTDPLFIDPPASSRFYAEPLGGTGKVPNIYGVVLRNFDNTTPGAADFWLWGTGAVNQDITL